MSADFEKTRCQCPICNARFTSFLPYGDTNRENARCPSCSSTERYRLLYLYLKNKTNLLNNKIKALEIAPSKCTQIFVQNVNDNLYVTTDISDHYRPKIINDARTLCFPDDAFDLVICYHVLEHIKEDRDVMRELYRVLKPGGIAFIQVPIDVNRANTFEDFSVPPSQYEEIFGQNDHVRIYGTDFHNRLQSVGFRVDVINYVSAFTAQEQELFGLKDQYLLRGYTTCEDLYVLTKPS